MAIDPTTPVTPIVPVPTTGSATDSVATLQAMARQALANTAAQLGEIVGGHTVPQAKPEATVEQAGQTPHDARHALDAARGPSAAAQQAAPARPESRALRAVRIAAAEAVPRQAGLAPLMANVRAVAERPDAPPEVRAAARTLLATAPSAAQVATSAGLRQAVERSGVFLEAKMARAAVAAPLEAASPLPEANDMKAALLVFRGALSAWLAKAAPPTEGRVATEPVRAPLDHPEGETSPAAPSPSLTARPSPSAPPASTVWAASQPASSGLNAAEPAPEVIAQTAPETASSTAGVSVSPSPPDQKPDVRAVELPPTTVRPDQPVEEEGLAARFGAFVAAPKSMPPAQAPVRAALSALVQLGLITEDALAEEPPTAPATEPRALATRGYGQAAPETVRAKALPPPYAGGPLAGQRPVAPHLPADLSPPEMVRRLLKDTNGALARQDLMQIASLPDAHEPDAVEARAQTASRLSLDLPFMTPQGLAVAQFEISHDGGGAGGGAVGAAERTYKARFSIDVEPLGPVHALVTLTGARTRVSFWAERAETIARLRAGEEILGAALRKAELSPEVAVHSGAPPAPGGVSPLGHFVDQAS